MPRWTAGSLGEATYPVLFCYRHAIELYLKPPIPGKTKRSHGLASGPCCTRSLMAVTMPIMLFGCRSEFSSSTASIRKRLPVPRFQARRRS